MRNTAIKDKAEFEARQRGFDFAVVGRAVLAVAVQAKAALVKMARAFSRGLRPAPQVKKPFQLVIEWSAIEASSNKGYSHET